MNLATFVVKVENTRATQERQLIMPDVEMKKLNLLKIKQISMEHLILCHAVILN